MEEFLSNAGSLGLDFLEQKYIKKDDENATKKDEQAKNYENIQQRTVTANSPLNNNLFLYGGVGLAAIVAIVLVVKK